MISTQTDLEIYPEFGNNSTKVMPDDAKYSNGFVQADVLPAEWMNWAWSKNTKGITALNKGVSSMEEELNYLVQQAGATPTAADNTQVKTAVSAFISTAILNARQSFFDAAHPVGSTYTQYGKVNDTNGTERTMSDPATIFNQNGITSSWVELNYAGAFFRGNGGLAENFNAGKQNEELPNIKGKLRLGNNIGFDGFSSIKGVFTQGDTTNLMSDYRSANGQACNFSASNGQTNADGTYKTAGESTYKDGGHVTPENYTIKIWLRTA